MLRSLFILITVLHFADVKAQKYYDAFIDSVIQRDKFTDKDWAIGITMAYNAPGMLIFDSLGNEIIDPELNSTIVISKINNSFYLQKFKDSCYFEPNCFSATKRISLPKTFFLNYTVDSIHQAEEEYVNEYIYKDSNNVYYYQSPSSHPTEYFMYFKTKKQDAIKYFNEDWLKKKLGFLSYENLNFNSTSKTFIYRSFVELKRLFKVHKGVLLIN
ncbi:MAG: hypothetical protein V4556_13705 [Bacteroidota bacterium]